MFIDRKLSLITMVRPLIMILKRGVGIAIKSKETR